MKHPWSLPLAFLAFLFASLGTCCVAAIVQARSDRDNDYMHAQQGIATFLLPVWVLALGIVIWLLIRNESGKER